MSNKMKWSSPVVFYDLMMGFFALCFLLDLFFGNVNIVTFAWPFCYLYYYYRRKAVKQLLEDSGYEEPQSGTKK